ncbi:MAG: protein kinase [Planctomycetota bacterium]|nr:protein kinase [Planctomycetota bacterium]
MAAENCPERGEWTRLLHEALTPDRQRLLERHLESCPECRRQLDELAGELPVSPQPGAAPPGTLLESLLKKMIADNAGGTADRAPLDPSLDPAIALPSGLLEPSTRKGSIGRIGQFEVLAVVGRGGLGVVLRAFGQRLNRVLAIKIPAPELVANPMVRKRFQREAQSAAAVSHDHVVRIYGVDEARDTPFLVMEYISGGSLQQEIDRRGALDVRQVVRVGMQLAQGLAAAHKQGLVHRDIKPANILLDGGLERVKLTDFGLARAVDDATLTHTGVIAGTPQYMSPEQARGETVDSRSDLFSLGSVLYTLCSGRPAFRADSPIAVLRRICDDEPRPLRQLNPDVPPWLAEIVETLLRKNPDERYQTAEEVASALESWLAHLQQPGGATPIAVFVPDSTRATPVAQTRRPNYWFAAAFIAFVLLSVFGACAFSLVGVRQRETHQIAQRDAAAVADWNLPGKITVEAEGGDFLRVTRTSPGLVWEKTFATAGSVSDRARIVTGPEVTSRRIEETKSTFYFQLSPGTYRLTLEIHRPDGDEILAEREVVSDPGIPVETKLSANSALGSGGKLDPVWHTSVRDNLLKVPAEVASIAYTPDSKSLLVAISRQGIYRLDRTPDGGPTPAGTSYSISPPATSPMGQNPGGQRNISIQRSRQNVSRTSVALTRLFPHESTRFSRIAFVSDDQLAVAGDDENFRVYSLKEPGRVQRFSGQYGVVWKFAKARNAPVFAAAGVGSTVLVWHNERGLIAKVNTAIDSEEKNVFGIGLSPDGNTLVTSGESGTLTVWDVPNSTVRSKIDSKAATGIEFVGAGDQLLTAGSDFRATLWSSDLQPIKHFSGHTGVITSLTVDLAHHRFATGSEDLTVRVWDLETGAQLANYGGHQKKITQVVFSPDGTQLASASEDQTVRFWNLPVEAEKP